MARVNGPLFSQSAEGQVGGKLIFRGGKSRPHVYLHSDRIDQANAESTPARSAERAEYQEARVRWQSLTRPEKSALHAIGGRLSPKLSGWNVLVHSWILGQQARVRLMFAGDAGLLTLPDGQPLSFKEPRR